MAAGKPLQQALPCCPTYVSYYAVIAWLSTAVSLHCNDNSTYERVFSMYFLS